MAQQVITESSSSKPLNNHIWVSFIASLFLFYGCSDQVQAPSPAPASKSKLTRIGEVSAERIIAADNEPDNWLAHGRTYDEQRYSPLKQINRDNVGRLGRAWEAPAGSVRGLEATPIVVDGVMFTTSTWSRVIALDAKTGEKLWEHDPKVERSWAKKLCCDIVNRGVAVWGGNVYVGTLDGYLLALDAASGEVDWRTYMVLA